MAFDTKQSGLRTRARHRINGWVERLNLRVETLTAQRTEEARLRRLAGRGQFEDAVFPVPAPFRSCDPRPVWDALERFGPQLERLRSARDNPAGFQLDNLFFGSPDAEAAYAMVRLHRPGTIVEIGSGHSTRLLRQAILDEGLETTLVSIDPSPRTDVSRLADVLHRTPVELLDDPEIVQRLGENDVLFIDSSHEIRCGNDVVHCYLQLLPRLGRGVLIHVHDVFLPFEYPRPWVLEKGRAWNEQYLVQAILGWSDAFEVLWPGHYLERTLPGFGEHFPWRGDAAASSLWLRKTRHGLRKGERE